MTPSGIILGFHGCGSHVAGRVVAGTEDLKPSRNSHDWLGEGIYFWAHDPRRAEEWAAERTLETAGKPAVVGGIIDLGLCLNLVEREAVEWVGQAYAHLKKLVEAENGRMPVNKKGARFLDNRVIEMLHRLRALEKLPPYDSVIGYFAEGLPIYEGADLRHQSHLQICVRSPQSILGYFFPKKKADSNEAF